MSIILTYLQQDLGDEGAFLCIAGLYNDNGIFLTVLIYINIQLLTHRSVISGSRCSHYIHVSVFLKIRHCAWACMGQNYRKTVVTWSEIRYDSKMLVADFDVLGGKCGSSWLHIVFIYTKRELFWKSFKLRPHHLLICWNIIHLTGLCVFFFVSPTYTSFANPPVSHCPKSFAFPPPGCDIGCVLRCICQDPTHTEVVPMWWLCKFSLCSHSSSKAKSFLPTPHVPPLYVLEEPEENFPPWLK